MTSSALHRWLLEAGVPHLEALLRSHAIDVDVLGSLSEADLAQIGLPLGDRKRVLQALARRPQAVAQPDGERRQLTILFADLVDATALCQSLSPEAWRDIVLAYQQAAVDILQRHGGVVAQYLGDGLLVYFGYPLAQEDAASRAVHSGLALVQAVAALNVVGGRGLRLRVGIDTGLVVVGDVGAGSHREHLALGDAPHLAARLQGLAPPGQVFIGEATRRLSDGHFVCEDQGVHALKGVRTPHQVWRVQGLSQAASRFDAATSVRLSPLVGRQQELALLSSRWQQVVQGRGQVVVLSGDAGMGKSRMVSELRQRMGNAGLAAWVVQCAPQHRHAEFHPLRESVMRRLGIRHGLSPDLQRERLRELVLRVHGLSEAHAKALADLLMLIDADSGRATPWFTTAQARHQAILAALVALIHARAHQRPTLLLVEDLHWADPGTLAFVQTVAHRLGDWPLLLLVTQRAETAPVLAPASVLTHVPVGSLSVTDTHALLDALADAHALSDELREHIAHKADGVPLFLEELTRSLIGGVVLPDGHAMVPSTLRDSLMARLDRHPCARELLQRAAVLGRSVDLDVLQAMDARPPAAFERDLHTLLQAGVLLRDDGPLGPQLAFRHALLQDAARDSLVAVRRQQLHAQVVHTLQTHFLARIDADPAELAHHATQAGLSELAVDHWRCAGERALAQKSLSEAVAHLDAGLSVALAQPPSAWRDRQEMQLRGLLGTTHMLGKGWAAPEVAQAYGRAQQLAGASDEVDDAIWPLWGNCVFQQVKGDILQASAIGRRMQTVARQAHSRQAWLVHDMMQSQLAFYSGRMAEVAIHAEQVEHRYNDPQDRSLIPLYSTDLLLVTRVHALHAGWITAQIDDVDARLQALQQRAHELNHAYSLAWALGWGAMVRLHRGDVDGLCASATQSLRLAEAHGHAYVRSMATFLLGWCAHRRAMAAGDVAPADGTGLATMRQGLADFCATGAGIAVPFFQTVLAEAMGESGDGPEGLALLADAWTRVQAGGERWYEAELHRVRGELLLRRPDVDVTEAATSLRLALTVAREQQAGRWQQRAQASWEAACVRHPVLRQWRTD